MKILVPLNRREDILPFREAGADELYLGFYDDAWEEKFGIYADINRMSGFGENANRYSFAELCGIIKEIRAANMDAFVTMNANVYHSEALLWIERHYLPALAEAGAKGVIVSTEQIAGIAVKYGLQAVASTMLGLYNSDIIRYYKSLGITRMIVPRDLSLQEIASIHENNPDVELEAFFMRNGCVFSDSYCLGVHRKACSSTCISLKELAKEIFSDSDDFYVRHEIELNDMLYNNYFHYESCGMCALYRMHQAGVASLKIVGRADTPHSVADDIRLTKENLEIMASCSDEKEYLDRTIFPRNSYTQCKLGLSCYYPEIRF